MSWETSGVTLKVFFFEEKKILENLWRNLFSYGKKYEVISKWPLLEKFRRKHKRNFWRILTKHSKGIPAETTGSARILGRNSEWFSGAFPEGILIRTLMDISGEILGSNFWKKKYWRNSWRNHWSNFWRNRMFGGISEWIP